MAELRIDDIQHRIGINDAELARRLGTNQTQLGRLKKGERGMTYDWLRRIAKALECNLVDLLPDVDFPNRPTEADMQLLEKIRAANGDAADLIDLLMGMDKLVQRQVNRRGTRHQLNGDPKLNAQLADLWDELGPSQRGYALEMLRAARSMRDGISTAA